MVKAYIISTGTELLLGSTLDTNSVFLSRRLNDLEIRVVGKSIVGDNQEMLARAFQLAMASADLIISTGGLGPTLDDLTKTVLCDTLGCKLEQRPEEVERLRSFFSERQREMPDSNLKQAMFPEGARVLPNQRGTAPGMYLKREGKVFVLLPGPPHEMEAMFEDVIPLLKQEYQGLLKKSLSKTIRVFGPGESKIEAMLKPILQNQTGVSMALLAQEGEVCIRVSSQQEKPEESQVVLDEAVAALSARLGDYIYGYDDDTLVHVVSKLLKEKRKTVALAESCTGGLLSKLMTDLPGSSAFFWGGICCYSNQAKVKLLGVSADTLEQFGAVSKETAQEMARGIRLRAGTDYGIGITGLAGPDGGSPAKPVGRVYISLAGEKDCFVKPMHFVGSRDAIRMLAAKTALDLLRRELLKDNKGDE
ncbi:MAG TPA: competence/damage-inducible protein A [Syntrophomonadaceae bacterium]|nr:competence/damage-inducible protein A [Syntrophomonadaceae bacterium]